MNASLGQRRAPPMYIRLLIAWATNAVLLGVVVLVLDQATTKNFGSLLEAAVVFGILNTVVKPILRFATLPLALLSLGIAWFFVSMLMLVLTRDIVSGFEIHGFTTLAAGTVIVWVVNLLLDVLPGPWQINGKRNRVKLRQQNI